MSALICLLRLGFLIEQRVHGGVVNHITEPTMNIQQTALDAYLARNAVIHTKLERLQKLTDDPASKGSSGIW